MAAHHGSAPWSPFLASTLPYLFQITQVPDARGEEAVYATGMFPVQMRKLNVRASLLPGLCKTNSSIENACAAIAKILHFKKLGAEAPQAVINQW